MMIGHIMFTKVTTDKNPNDMKGCCLKRLAARPGQQRRGVGKTLVREGLKRMQEAGYDYVLVLGHASYYPRFGFVMAEKFDMRTKYKVSESFMILELTEGAAKNIAGALCVFWPQRL